MGMAAVQAVGSPPWGGCILRFPAVQRTGKTLPGGAAHVVEGDSEAQGPSPPQEGKPRPGPWAESPEVWDPEAAQTRGWEGGWEWRADTAARAGRGASRRPRSCGGERRGPPPPGAGGAPDGLWECGKQALGVRVGQLQGWGSC